MQKSSFRTADGASNSHVARNQRKHMGSAFHEFLYVGHALQRILNHAFISLRKLCLAAELLDVIAISRRTRHSTRGSVRLFQVTCICQVRHHVADRRWAEAFAAGPRENA